MKEVFALAFLLTFGLLTGCESAKKAPVVNLNNYANKYRNNNYSKIRKNCQKDPKNIKILQIKKSPKFKGTISKVEPKNNTKYLKNLKPNIVKTNVNKTNNINNNTINKTSNIVDKKGNKKVNNLNNNKIKWNWPTKGKIIKHFKESNHAKGIDISGTASSSIKSASSGKVVYSGSGLKGYGNLIIIKHKNDFLSAYAHNDKLMVKEGEEVEIGQEIATMGKTDSERVKLHFEIRHNGKPVDPLRYLPKR